VAAVDPDTGKGAEKGSGVNSTVQLVPSLKESTVDRNCLFVKYGLLVEDSGRIVPGLATPICYQDIVNWRFSQYLMYRPQSHQAAAE